MDVDWKSKSRALSPWITAAADLLWPPQCAGCGNAISTGKILCRACEAKSPVITPPFCEVCSQPFPGGEGSLICNSCRERNFQFVCSLSSMQAHGFVREMIHRLKYNGERWLARPLAQWMHPLCNDPRLRGVRIDFLAPVPLHSLRERERGYNQAELIARELAKLWNLPFVPALKRKVHTETQTRFDRRERMKNLRSAFVVPQPERISGKKILLVDDVFTTGSTLDECARTLLDAGGAGVWCATAARA